MIALLVSVTTLVGNPPPREAGNAICPVTGFSVANPRARRTVEVWGVRYAVYDRRAAILLKQWPEGYLDLKGIPLNAHPAHARSCDPACPCGRANPS